jgi:two-component system nitrogen regulation sensor histidine kinase NtrY
VSLSRRFAVYLVLLHLLFAAFAVVVLWRQRVWLLAVEAVFALSLLAGFGLLRRLHGDLAPLEEAPRLLAENEFTTRFREVGQPEIDTLIEVYNRMADALREERTRNQEQQSLLARILDASPSGVVILDFDGRVAYANPAAARLLGSAAGDAGTLHGLGLGDLQSPLAGPLTALGPGEAAVGALSGARRVRLQRGSFLDRGFTRSFLLLEELTEELRQSEKAAYEKLVRMMSHEVGNTVGAGRSLLESCLAYAGGLPEADRPTFTEALGVVISRLGQLHDFTGGFAEVVRLPPPRPASCELAVVLRAVATLLRPAASAGSIDLRLEVDPAAPPVLADRTQIEQALVNVGKNAIEAAGAGGSVVLRLAGRGERAVLEVEDSGPGIPPEVAAQLFTPFFSTKEKGQGLGLTLVQEVLRQHGCEFALEGPPGGPTRFTIAFPQQTTRARPIAPARPGTTTD